MVIHINMQLFFVATFPPCLQSKFRPPKIYFRVWAKISPQKSLPSGYLLSSRRSTYVHGKEHEKMKCYPIVLVLSYRPSLAWLLTPSSLLRSTPNSLPALDLSVCPSFYTLLSFLTCFHFGFLLFSDLETATKKCFKKSMNSRLASNS